MRQNLRVLKGGEMASSGVAPRDGHAFTGVPTRVDEGFPGAPDERRTRSRIIGRAGVVVLATLLPAMTWLVAVQLAGIYLEVPAGQSGELRPIGLPAVITSALAGCLLGWVGLAVLERVTAWSSLAWTLIALAVVGLSFVPLFDPEMPGGTVVVFTIMRLLIAGVLIPGLVWFGARSGHGNRSMVRQLQSNPST